LNQRQPPTPEKISNRAGVERMILATIKQAIIDCSHRKPYVSHHAAYWLLTDGNIFWVKHLEFTQEAFDLLIARELPAPLKDYFAGYL
jgi:hypothetical protein